MTAAFLIACSPARAPGTVEITPAPTATAAAVASADLATTIENVVLACREKDVGALNALILGAVSPGQIEALFALGRDVVLKGQTPSITGDQASVTVQLEITRSSGTERVERTWSLARGADGFWRVTALPDCY